MLYSILQKLQPFIIFRYFTYCNPIFFYKF
nr:MAG TPA: hypothetical protein [Bacteriophage sp.]